VRKKIEWKKSWKKSFIKMDDPRFSKLFTDPKFRNVPKKERKVKIDERFQSMFKDKRFVSKVGVDKRGRPGNFTTKENFEKFYHLESSSDASDEDDDKKEKQQKVKAKKNVPKAGKKPIQDPNVDYARGEAVLSDSSSDEDDSSSEDEEKEKDDSTEAFDKWGELDHDAEMTDKTTCRMAVCNMDWDRVGAEDLFLILTSFCPPGCRVIKVSIFPSEFGKQRMAEEDALGPSELRTGVKPVSDSESSDDEDHQRSSKDMERVRTYQVNRLKYFYAVAEFNNEIAANRVYTQCDGIEYELSATRFDLRFIPDDMEFNDDLPKEICDQTPDGEKYKPKLFSTSALSLGKVDLTWDETDPERVAAMQKAFEMDEIDDDAVKAYIASSSDDDCDKKKKKRQVAYSQNEEESDQDDEEDVIAKYRALLGGIDPSSNDKKAADDESDDEEGGMEMTFVPEAHKKRVTKEMEVEKMTPWEQYLHKKKEKRKEKRTKAKTNQDTSDESDDNDDTLEDNDDDVLPSDIDLNDPFFKQEISNGVKKGEKSKKKTQKAKKTEPIEEETKDLSLLVMDSDDDKEHFDYKDIVKKESKSKKARRKADRKVKDADKDNFKLDLKDSRFSAIFDTAEYNVDPSNPNFKKTKSMQEIIEEKQKRILSGSHTSSEKRKKLSSMSAAAESKPKSAKLSDNDQKSALPASLSLVSLANSVKLKSDRLGRKLPKKIQQKRK
jgi:hypothetical protein